MDINLREIQESDLEQIMNWRMDPDITRYMKTDPQLTLVKQKEWLESITSDEKVKYWLIEIDNTSAGVINLDDIDWKNGTSSWGYYIGEKKTRSFQAALALEMSLYEYVFDTLSFKEIHNEVLSLNAAVIKIHETCGNRIVRVGKNEVEKNGEFYDVTHMSLMKEDWFSIREKMKYQELNFDTEMRLHHIGYAVSDIEKSAEKFEKSGYFRDTEIFSDKDRNVNIQFIRSKYDDTVIELISPKNESSPITRRLAVTHNTAEPYHICYEVSNLNRSICELQRQSFYMVKNPSPAIALEGNRVAFMMSRETGLIELLERPQNRRVIELVADYDK